MSKKYDDIKSECITGTVAKAADRYAMDVMGLKSLALMETASSKIAEYVMKHFPLAQKCTDASVKNEASDAPAEYVSLGDAVEDMHSGVDGALDRRKVDSQYRDLKLSVLCGVGNNGADGVCASRMLLGACYQPQVYIVGNLEKASWEFLYQLCRFQQAGGAVTMYRPDTLPDDDILIDAIFGIGLHRDIAGDYRLFIEEANRRSHGFVLAVDAPSGINTDTGELMGCGIKADVTITFGRNKTGLVCGAGQKFAGRVLVEDIGIPDEAYIEAETHA